MEKSFLKFPEVCIKLRILVIDESQTTRRVLSALVSSRWTVCGKAKNGKSAETQFRELKRDLVLLDLGRPDIDGPEVGRQMHAIDPSGPLTLFTLSDPWSLEGAARSAGIRRVISKSESGKLMDAIEKIVAESSSSSVGRKARVHTAKAKLRATAS
jgi:two-component system, chemotaxis family, chemotaxis protein CheY